MDPFTLGLAGVFLVGLLFVMVRLKPKLVQLSPNQALVRNRILAEAGVEVFFQRAVIIPAVDVYELMDLSVQTMKIDLRGREGVRCLDNIKADVEMSFSLKVPNSREEVMTAAEHVGCSGVSDPEKLFTLFEDKFIEAIRSVFRLLNFAQVMQKQDDVREAIINKIGCDLAGFHLHDASIKAIEQTPLFSLDPENVLDAEAITRITEQTAPQHIATNQIRKAAEDKSAGTLPQG